MGLAITMGIIKRAPRIQHPQRGRAPTADTKLEIVLLLKEGGKKQRKAAEGRAKQTKLITCFVAGYTHSGNYGTSRKLSPHPRKTTGALGLTVLS